MGDETVGRAKRELDLRPGSSLGFPVYQLFDLGQVSFCEMEVVIANQTISQVVLRLKI